MGKKKKLKIIRRMAVKLPDIPNTNHYRRMKRAFYRRGLLGVISYIKAVEAFFK